MVLNELQEVSFLSIVKIGGLRLTTGNKVGAGLDLVSASVEGGWMTVKSKTGEVTMVPLTNVGYVVPAKKPEAPKK